MDSYLFALYEFTQSKDSKRQVTQQIDSHDPVFTCADTHFVEASNHRCCHDLHLLNSVRIELLLVE